MLNIKCFKCSGRAEKSCIRIGPFTSQINCLMNLNRKWWIYVETEILMIKRVLYTPPWQRHTRHFILQYDEAIKLADRYRVRVPSIHLLFVFPLNDWTSFNNSSTLWELINALYLHFIFSFSRPAELPGCQPPGVAHTCGGYVLLVASDGCVHHAL